jgi:hypothetical protein
MRLDILISYLFCVVNLIPKATLTPTMKVYWIHAFPSPGGRGQGEGFSTEENRISI